MLASCGKSAGPVAHERGRGLFHGELPLSAHVQASLEPLPPLAARCANCHSGPSFAQQASVSGRESFGPELSARTLKAAIARRGGPASRYDEASFCKALKDGVDPAYVTLPRAMPRYTLPESDCLALWGYLTQTQ